MTNDPLPAKLTQPHLHHAVARPRVVEALRDALKPGLAWLQAPAGFGKTTAICTLPEMQQRPSVWYRIDASDQDPIRFFEHLRRALGRLLPSDAPALPTVGLEQIPQIEVFARQFFDAVARCLPGRLVLVFDDVHDVDPDAHLHRVVAVARETLPETVGLCLASRHSPPPAYARLQAQGRMGLLEVEALRLTPAEAAEVLSQRVGRRVPSDIAEALSHQAEGWSAGVVLLGEQLRRGRPPGEQKPIFDFFWGEVLHGVDGETQAFLLKVALLPQVSGPLAQQATRTADAEQRLSQLVSEGAFITQHGSTSFVLHALFREFLLAQSRAHLPAEQRRSIQRDAGEALAQQGEIEQAAQLFAEAEDWRGLRRVLLEFAPGLVHKGQHISLNRCLSRLPDDIAADDPDLQYWLGIAQAPMDPRAARTPLARAYAGYRGRDDAEGVLAALGQLMQCFVTERDAFCEADPWLDALDDWISRHGLPSIDKAASALPFIYAAWCHRQPDHPRLAELEGMLRAAIPALPDPSTRVLCCATVVFMQAWRGDLGQMQSDLALIEPDVAPEAALTPMARLTYHIVDSVGAWLVGDYERAKRSVDAGLAHAETTGVSLWNANFAAQASTACLALGDMDGASRYLDAHPPKRSGNNLGDVAYQQMLRGLIALRQGRVSRARADLNAAASHAQSVGVIFLQGLCQSACVQLALATEDWPAFEQGLRDLRISAKRMGGGALKMYQTLLHALFLLRHHRTPEARRELAVGFAIVREGGMQLPVWWRPEDLSELCAAALEADIEPQYVQELIRTHALEPPRKLSAPSWPWPVRLQLLGKVRAEIDGQPVSLSGRPLELLGAIVALGPDGSVAQRIAALLWPEQDEVSAAASLKTTLSRLRKLIGHDSIVLDAGMMRLNQQRVWVDADVLESKLADERPELIAAWYGGDFLPSESASWVQRKRRRLRHRAMRLFAEGARHLSARGEQDAAVRLWERGLDFDPTNERLYAGLIDHYVRRGQPSLAMQVYRRCAEALRQELGAQPGPELLSLVATANDAAHHRTARENR